MRQVTLDDLQELYLLKSDERVLKYLNTKPKTIEETRQFIIRLTEGILNGEWILWGITLKNHSKVIGTICLWNFSPEEKKEEIGYELMPEYQGRGIMQEAMTGVLRYGFFTLGLEAIEAFTHRQNLKSIKLLEKNKFSLQGSKQLKDHPDNVWYLLKREKYLGSFL
ncbi:GNAT family N-acetyltransferase [Thermosediminibacter litoriperuensis]|uniref:GNAT family N-acetyltransferase n=1 Tax=Thermosediminibacter litoriperuensis TaxID=291989 RepID=UPI00248311AB|nr:GNAT family N-acetyltransferase [Thermosediminibacter litoriperuensis]